MGERAILFSAPMVRALLDGRKTQTRRVLKPQPTQNSAGLWSACPRKGMAYQLSPDLMPIIAPVSKGDRLWVREAFQEFLASEFPPGRAFGPRGDFGIPAERAKGNVSFVAYRADGEFPPHPEDGKAIWRSPIHMPRKYSRLTLVVTDVRVQRLQDCSEDDAFAEGIETDAWDMAPVARRYGTDGWFVGWPDGVLDPSVSVEADVVCRRSYETLWEQINGAGSWAANPWIAAYTFTVEHRNIDEGLGQRADATPNSPLHGESGE